jgi:hypothetical protein
LPWRRSPTDGPRLPDRRGGERIHRHGLTALLIWVATVLAGSSDPWSIAPWLVSLVAALVAVGTYMAEGIAHRKTLARMRSTGEPWAYREG